MPSSNSFLICKLQVSPHGTGRSVGVEGMLSPCQALTTSQPSKLESWKGNDACCYVVWLLWTRHSPELSLLLCFAFNSPKHEENTLSKILLWDSRDGKWYFLLHGCPHKGSSMQTKSLGGSSMQNKSLGGSSMQTKSLGGSSMRTKSLALTANTSCHAYGAIRKAALLFPRKNWAPYVSYGTEDLETCSRIEQKIAEDSKLPLGGNLVE